MHHLIAASNEDMISGVTYYIVSKCIPHGLEVRGTLLHIQVHPNFTIVVYDSKLNVLTVRDSFLRAEPEACASLI